MQKLKDELNVNVVGANCIRPHFEEMTLKKQKGITLIALIITIIVMLILVGVTINVALNGGVFIKAETATKETERELIEEIALGSYVFEELAAQEVVLSILDMPATGRELYKNLTTSGFKLKDENGNEFTTAEAFLEANGGEEITAFDLNIKGRYGEYEGIIEKRGLTSEGIKIKGEQPSNPGERPTVPDEPEMPELPEGLTVGSEFEMDADENGTPETWIVLYDGTASHLKENEIEVISKNVLGEKLALGKTDTEAITNATDIDGDGTVEDMEIAIYSYNNAIDRINNYCESLIKVGNLGVRSVGSKPGDETYRNTSTYEMQYLDEWTDTGKIEWNTYKIYGEDADTNLEADYDQMNKLGITSTSYGNDYWLASRKVREGTAILRVYFDVWYVTWAGSLYEYGSLWGLANPSTHNAWAAACAVRPVIKLQYAQ